MSEKEEAEKSKQLVERAFRWPKYVTIQRLISRNLFTATCTNNPSQILQNICRASMKVESMLESEKIKDVDFRLLRDLYNFDACLNSPELIKFDCVWSHGAGWVCRKLYRIHWNFETRGPEGKANFERLASAWFEGVNCWSQFIRQCKEKRVLVHCGKCGFTLLNEVAVNPGEYESEEGKMALFNLKLPGIDETHEEEYRNPYWPLKDGAPRLLTRKVTVHYVKCAGCGEKLTVQDINVSEKSGLSWSRPWLVFFEETQCLTESGLSELRNGFYVWAITTIIEDATTKLSQIIDPEILKDIETLMGASSKLEEGEKEE